mgnify:CR=1 FL=1
MIFDLFGQSIDTEITKLINTGNENQLLKESSKYIQNEYYFQANKIVDKLLEKNNTSSNYNYRKGFLLTKINNQFQEAIPYFEKAKERIINHVAQQSLF